MKTIIDTFFKQRGWLHLITFVSMVYELRFWGLSEYASKTVEFPTSMIYELMTLPSFKPILVTLVPFFILAILVEGIQIQFFEGKFSVSDVSLSLLGVLLAFIIPINLVVFVLSSVVILVIFVTVIKTIYERFKNKL